jgi:hypothetical protein
MPKKDPTKRNAEQAQLHKAASRWLGTLSSGLLNDRKESAKQYAKNCCRAASPGQPLHHLPRDVRQPEIPALIFVRQPCVIEAQQL